MIVIAKHRALLDRLGLTTLDRVKAFQGELIKNHRGRRDILRIDVRDEEGRSRILYLKRNWRPYKKDGLSSLLRRGVVWSSARREWENAESLEAAGVSCADRIAYGEDCNALWERFSFLITESARGQSTLQDFIRNCGTPAIRRRVFDALAHEIRRMHRAGLATPDLFTRHVFVDPSDSPPRFCWIDMARLDRRSALPLRLCARDLAALNLTAPLHTVSIRERLRFLARYSGSHRIDRRLLRLIVNRSRSLARRRRKFQDFARAEVESKVEPPRQ